MTFLKNNIQLLLFACLLSSCNGEEAQDKTEKANALLTWSGEYAVDGCGFTVVIGEETFKPDNEDAIPESFKTEAPTAVNITFVRLPGKIDIPCGLSPESRAMDGIRVVSVVER